MAATSWRFLAEWGEIHFLFDIVLSGDGLLGNKSIVLGKNADLKTIAALERAGVARFSR